MTVTGTKCLVVVIVVAVRMRVGGAIRVCMRATARHRVLEIFRPVRVVVRKIYTPLVEHGVPLR